MIHILGKNSNTKLTNVREEDIQPNAVDLRLDKVFKISDNLFEIDEQNNKTHRGSTQLEPNADGFWCLEPGFSYEVIMENVIDVGEDEAGWVITRSTLNRNGCFITSGLYDSGYNGVMAGVLHVTCGPIKIQRGTRIGQYISFKSEALKKYDGSYGSNSDHDKKYN